MTTLKKTCQIAAVLLFCAAIPAGAQDMIVAGTAAEPLSANELEQLLRPIAPIPIPSWPTSSPRPPCPRKLSWRTVTSAVAVIRLKPRRSPGDPSVQARDDPAASKWLDDNLPWTTEVGEAFLNQQQDVMDSIQHLRFMAQGEGNLPSTPQENVVNDGGIVEIEPVNPEIIYVPTYPWDTIYYDSGIHCSFGVGFPIGLWLP